mmetsp:Transcript_7869/g.15753  ORF Transcript_7869/g.15753 Transcript_7869/m.15753 type:complete len:326 (-) Transcript_7869:139-1116(-)
MAIKKLSTFLITFFSIVTPACLALKSISIHTKPLQKRTMSPRSNLSVSSLTSLVESGSCSLGFVGCGTIASAIATGLAKQSVVPINQISVSKRSEKKSSALVSQFPSINVFEDNQNVVDNADIIFVTVLPQQVNEVLRGLKFDTSRHVLVSLVSTSNLEDLAEYSGLPSECIFKMICLPSVAESEGVCLLTPPTENSVIVSLLESLGGVVQAENEKQMSAMMVTSGLMGSFYGILKNNRDFLVKQGIDSSKASFLVGRMYHSMIRDAEGRCRDPQAYEELIAEQTPGGLNEQGLENLTKLGALDAFDKVQDAMLDRIEGKSDGSL